MSGHNQLSRDQLADLKGRVPLPSLIAGSIALQKDGHEYTALCPFHSEDTPSFRVWRDHAYCFGCGWHGDAIDWLMERESMSFTGAVRHLREWSGTADPKVPVGQLNHHGRELPWQPILPVPAEAPPLIDAGGVVRAFNPKREGTCWEWTRWRPALVHVYRTASGDLIAYVLRVEKREGGKFTPCLTYCEHKDTAERRWCVVPLPMPRPLYGLEELARRPTATVLVVEGEKTADAARRLLPSLVTVTWAGGSKAYHLTDWSPLRGRKVVGVPDADREGREAFDGRTNNHGRWVPGILEILASIGAKARPVEPPAALADGWDLADAEAEQWDTGRTLAWIKAHLTAGVRDAT